MKLVVLDYGMGNLHSIARRLTQIGATSVVSCRIEDIKSADKLILPGVGHFGKAMENLKKLNLIDELNDLALIRRKPVLGICLGLQLMTQSSEEGNAKGLGWFNSDVLRFHVNDKAKFKIPHTGWNQVHFEKESVLSYKVPQSSEFYFVHAYRCVSHDVQDVLGTTDYESRFVSALQKENLFGVQFHPEKSHDLGSQMLLNFANL
jgi:glutamine amidotransferase